MVNYANESDDYLKFYVEHREESIHNLHEAIELVKEYEVKIKPVLNKVGLGLTMESTFGQVLTAMYSELGIYTNEVMLAKREMEKRKVSVGVEEAGKIRYFRNGVEIIPLHVSLINPEAKD